MRQFTSGCRFSFDLSLSASTEVTPKFVSPSDPAARSTGAHGGQAFSAYSTNYLVDVENAIIVDVEATTAIRQAEVLAAKRMIERSLEKFELYPSRLLGDSAYGSMDSFDRLQFGIERQCRCLSDIRHERFRNVAT